MEAYIERDISKLEVGDVLIADGHTLNFQVINPFTGKPTRATLVGFLDWKSTALVGYEIMMSENTQCIASALRNAIINLGMIPKVVYQDNGKAFKAKYFHDKQGEKNLSRSLTGARCDFLAQALKNQHTCQSCDCLFGGVKRARSSKAADFSPLPPSRFDEEGFNGIYAKLTIKLIFIKSYNVTDNFFVFVFLYICVLRFRMCELMIHTIPHVYNKVTGTTSSESAVQVASALAVPEKKDSFEKSNSKMLAATSAATIGGGVIGAIFAKMTEATRRVPNSILKKYNLDFGKYGSARAKIEAQVSEEEITPLLKSLANKLLSNEELTPYELELAKKIDLEPNMVRFLDSAKERAKILLDEINKHPKNLGDAIGGYSVLSTCFDRNSLNMQVDFAKRLCSIEENGLRYSNNEEFLNYLSSEFFKGITFKIKYDKNGIEKDIVPSLNFKEALSNGDILSDATYTYKELVDKIIIKNEFNRNLSQTNLSFLPLTIFNSKNYNHIPSGQKLTEYYLMVCNAAVDKAKAVNDELKNSAIKAYNNKQILKSAGIGVLVTGAVALCAALICRKDKEKE